MARKGGERGAHGWDGESGELKSDSLKPSKSAEPGGTMPLRSEKEGHLAGVYFPTAAEGQE